MNCNNFVMIDLNYSFCYLTKESIHNEFESSIMSEQHMMVGEFRDDQLTTIPMC